MPSLCMEEISLTPADIAAEVERTRMIRLIELDAKIKRLRDQRDDISSEMRWEMNHNGVVRYTIKGVGTAELIERVNCFCGQPYTIKPDPYLKVKSA